MKINLSTIGLEFKPTKHPYLWKDVIFYHLGIGAKATELPYVFEGIKGGLQVIPTFAAIPAIEATATVIGKVGVNPIMMLHGEQAIYMHRPIPQRGEFITTPVVTGIWDKGKGALLEVKTITRDQKGNHLFDTMVSLYCRGQGGFGGERGPERPDYAPPPGKDPDFTDSYETSLDQAALYRLSGDLNPLHINPDFAKQAGYDRPILHGLCIYGGTLKSIINGLCDGDVKKIKEYKARFANTIYPGDKIFVKAWKLKQDTYSIETSTQNHVVMNQAYVKIEAD